MVQLHFENLIGGQTQPFIKFLNLAGLAPHEQWFYCWVRDNGLATSYPELRPTMDVLLKYLPQRTKRYSKNIPDLDVGESWLRLVLKTGELIKLQPDSHLPPLTIAVNPSAIHRLAYKNLETISSPEFSAARRALGIDKHLMLVFNNIADAEPESNKLLNALINQAKDPAECAVIHI